MDRHAEFYLAGVHVQPGLNQTGSQRIDTKSMDVLIALANAAPDPVATDELLDQVWPDVVVVDSVVHKAIARTCSSIHGSTISPGSAFISHSRGDQR